MTLSGPGAVHAPREAVANRKKGVPMKKYLSMFLALAVILHLAAPALAAEGTSFADVPESHWAYAYIERAARAGVVNGTGEGCFSPGEPLGMAAFTAMIIRGVYGEEMAAQHAGAGGGQWYSGHTAAAASLGLYEGTEVEDRFAAAGGGGEDAYAVFLSGSIDWDVTRYDMASIMSRLIGTDGAEIPLAESELQAARDFAAKGAALAVADWEQVPEKYREGVALCYYYGLLTGTDSQGTFNGGATVTRAQAAAVLCRLLDARESGVTPVEYDVPAAGDQAAAPEIQGPTLTNGQPITEENVLAMIEALKEDYPEGMRWTNANFYQSHALRFNGYGCVAFAAICSDTVFGNLPVTRKHNEFDAIRAGDMLRVRGNSHTVIVLEKRENSVIIAEGNYNEAIHWGRELTREYLEGDRLFYAETRYPEGN